MKTVKCSKCNAVVLKNFLTFKSHLEKHDINKDGTEYNIVKDLWATASK